MHKNPVKTVRFPLQSSLNENPGRFCLDSENSDGNLPAPSVYTMKSVPPTSKYSNPSAGCFGRELACFNVFPNYISTQFGDNILYFQPSQKDTMTDFSGEARIDGKSKNDVNNETKDSDLRVMSSNSIDNSLKNLSTESNSSLKRKYEDDCESAEDRLKKNFASSPFCVSPWEFRRLKADLMESQAQRIKLEDRIDQLHKKNKEAVIFFDKEKNEMKSQLDLNRNTIKDLEYRLNKVRKREIECREELSEKTKHYEQAKQKFSEKIIKLETENSDLNSKVDKLKFSLEESLFKVSDQLRSLKEDNEMLKLKIEEKESLCCSLETRLDSANENCKELEQIKHQLHTAQLKIKSLESEKQEYEEAKNVTVALSEKVLRIPELERELNEKKLQVANLRQFLHSNVMLEEVVHDLKTKLAAVEDREKEIPLLKAKAVQLESELEKWKAIAGDFTSSSTRDSLRDYIESLQRKELTTSLEMNDLNASVRSSEKTLSTLKHELESVQSHKEKLEATLQKLKVEVQMLRKKSMLISRERDSYRQQLDLYEKDLTVTGLSSESFSNEVLSQMKTRVKNLETSLGDYRKHVETLESQLKEYQAEEPVNSVETICKLKEEIKNLEYSNQMLTKMKDELEQKLEAKAEKGDYISSNYKILHFRNNPAYEAEKKQEEDIKTLKEECDRLRSRVKLLESGDVLNITQKVTEDLKSCNSQKVAELEKELQSANIKMQRLKEVFKKTSQEFRDVSYMLLGYRIDLASNNKLYKLYNMYSSSPLDYLMFQQTKGGAMEMLGTEFAESMSKLVDEYLHKGNSIPAFLSAVTLELYGAGVQSDDDEDEKEDENFQGSDSSEAIQLD